MVIDWWLVSWDGRDALLQPRRRKWMTMTLDDWQYSTAPIIVLDAPNEGSRFQF